MHLYYFSFIDFNFLNYTKPFLYENIIQYLPPPPPSSHSIQPLDPWNKKMSENFRKRVGHSSPTRIILLFNPVDDPPISRTVLSPECSVDSLTEKNFHSSRECFLSTVPHLSAAFFPSNTTRLAPDDRLAFSCNRSPSRSRSTPDVVDRVTAACSPLCTEEDSISW